MCLSGRQQKAKALNRNPVEPCGTPKLTLNFPEEAPFSETRWLIGKVGQPSRGPFRARHI